MKTVTKIVVFLLLGFFINSCSIQKAAINMISDALSGSGGGSTASALTGDDDLELVGDALPFALKLYETLLSQNPEHKGLLSTTGMAFIMYANAFVQTPADMLPQDDYEKQGEMYLRAKKLFLRGRDYVLKSLEVGHKGFLEDLYAGDFETALSGMKKEDTDNLYWASAGWLAAFSINPFDIAITVEMPKVIAMLTKLLELDEAYGKGGLHDLLISVQASLPEELMYRAKFGPEKDSVRIFLNGYYGRLIGTKDGANPTPEEKARFHFLRALELAEGKNPSPYLSLATSVCISKQYAQEFIDLMNKALAVDPEKDPDNKLAITLARKRARWYLDNMNLFFLIETDEDNTDNFEGGAE